MAPPTEKGSSSSSRCTTPTPLMPGRIVVAYDATKNHNIEEFEGIIANIMKNDGMIHEADTITVLGVLHKALHPMGFQIQIGNDSFVAHARAIKENVVVKVNTYVGKLQHCADECAGNRVNLEIKIVVGSPIKKTVVQEVAASNATWVIIDRELRKELSFYLKHISCKVAAVLDNLSLEVLRPQYCVKAARTINHKPLYALSKLVPPSPAENFSTMTSADGENSSSVVPITTELSDQMFPEPDDFVIEDQHEQTGINVEVEDKTEKLFPILQEQRSIQSYSEVPPPMTESEVDSTRSVHSTICDFSNDTLHGGVGNAQEESKSDGEEVVQQPTSLEIDLDVMKICSKSLVCSYLEIKTGTNNFSFDNLLGEGACGVVYKGQLKNGQFIAVKVQEESNTQGFKEFQSEADALCLALHKNVVMLLGYCSTENSKLLVYEYLCNSSLEWHLFGNAHVLEWYRRRSISIGIAKGLRFLHEECRGSPIVHGDLRPRKILLTHDFVPLLGDYGLEKWKKTKSDKPTEAHDSLVYLAPERAENGICSVKSDVYAFGIVLIQLISGRKEMDSNIEDNSHLSLRQWALPLIEKLAIDELVDHRLGDSYSMYELYQMAKAARLCVQHKPAMRPTMGEVLYLLEGKSDYMCL